MELIVNNNIVRIWHDVKPNWLGLAKEYTYNSPESIGSGSVVKVAFINDSNDKQNGDRNLKVNKIEIDGVTYQAENPSVYSVGGWANKREGCSKGYLQTQWLYCDGYFRFRVK